MNFPFGKTITVIPQTTDNRGNRVTGDPVAVPGCAWWSTPGVETVNGQDTVVYDCTILAPAGTSVSATDRITLEEVTYEVVAQPIAWESSLTGRKPCVELHVRKVTG